MNQRYLKQPVSERLCSRHGTEAGHQRRPQKAVVAYPLWSNNELAGSAAEEMTYAFSWVVLAIVAMPWRYAVRTYITGRNSPLTTSPTGTAAQQRRT